MLRAAAEASVQAAAATERPVDSGDEEEGSRCGQQVACSTNLLAGMRVAPRISEA
jgi:hypothetical protein